MRSAIISAVPGTIGTLLKRHGLIHASRRSRRATPSFPARLPQIEYPAGYAARRVQEHGEVHCGNRRIFLSEVLTGEMVVLEQDENGWRIWCGPIELARLDRRHLLRRGRAGSKIRVRLRYLERVSARAPGSLRRAPNTPPEEASDNELPPAQRINKTPS